MTLGQLLEVIANRNGEIQRLKDLKANIPHHLNTHFSRERIETDLRAIYRAVVQSQSSTYPPTI